MTSDQTFSPADNPVGTAFQDNTAAAADDNGWKLFDAVVNGAMRLSGSIGGGEQPTAVYRITRKK